MEGLIVNFATEDATEVLEEVARERLKNAVLKAFERAAPDGDWEAATDALFGVDELAGFDRVDALATRIAVALADGLAVRVDDAPVGTVPIFEDAPFW